MKKVLLAFTIFVFGSAIFAQDSKTQSETSKIDFVIIEMNLKAVLGGYSNGKLVDAKIAKQGLNTVENYKLFGIENLSNNNLKLTKINDEMTDICPDFVSVETDSNAESGVALSSNSGWNAMPRLAKEIDKSNLLYRGIVSKYLKENKIRNPNVQIKKILKVDLEGDGIDEVIIHASNRGESPGFSTKVGDYSFIVVRKIVDGKVKTIPLMTEFALKKEEFSAPSIHKISSVLDLDGDGKMEIVTYGAYYEGAWAEAYSIQNGKATKVLETGCGV